MLWECEEKSPDFWAIESLQSSVRELLKKMMLWLECNQCRNYFIPGNNMMDHLANTDVSIDVAHLRDYLKQDSLICGVLLQRSLANEIFTQHAQYQIETPRWFYRTLLMINHVFNSAKRECANRKKTVSSEVQRALEEELSDICQGIYFQREAAACVKQEEKQRLYSKAKQYLDKAVRVYEASEPCFIDLSLQTDLLAGLAWMFLFTVEKNTSTDRHTIDSEFKTLHPTYVARAQYWNSITAERQDAAQRCSLESPVDANSESFINVNTDSREIVGAKSSTKEVALRCYSVFQESETTTTYYDGFIPNAQGVTPSVSMSWFVAKAYMANLVYTAYRDYATAIRICDEMIEVFVYSVMNKLFAEIMFPVSLSTQWTAAYDAEIQRVLGFYALCSFVSDAERSRDVYLGICPIQFSIYLKIRCALDQGRSSEFEKLKRDWKRHGDRCSSDKNTNNGRVLLVSIIRFITTER